MVDRKELSDADDAGFGVNVGTPAEMRAAHERFLAEQAAALKQAGQVAGTPPDGEREDDTSDLDELDAAFT